MARRRKQYVDCGVQTSPSHPSSSSPCPTIVSVAPYVLPSNNDASRRVAHSSSQTESSDYRSLCPRTVSNPEHATLQAILSKLSLPPVSSRQPSARSVSLPDSALLPSVLDSSDTFDDLNISSRSLRVHKIPADSPRTPSPPSSPESVLFIENSGPVSGSFLQQRMKPQVPARMQQSEEGWVTWGSPPKPIPALHGPLSLPYARCPSGAEGTIIEEQSSLPRMIWGLNPPGSEPAAQDNCEFAFNPHARPYTGTDRAARRPSKKNLHAKDVGHNPAAIGALFGHPSHHHATVQNEGVSRLVDCVDRPAPTSSQLNPLEDELVYLDLRREAVRRMDQQTGRRPSSSPDLLSLLGANLPVQGHRTSTADFQKSNHTPLSYLPTPPNPATPVFSSIFSPLPNGQQETPRQLYTPISPADLKTRTMQGPSSAELSAELRRLVFGIRSHPSTPFLDPNFSLPRPDANCPSAETVTSAFSTLSPARPPVSKWDLLNSGVGKTTPLTVSNQQRASPMLQRLSPKLHDSPKLQQPSPRAERRGTLTNPRSVPISRLRNSNKPGLAPVPEEPEHVDPISSVLRSLLDSPPPGLLPALIPQSRIIDADISANAPRVRLPDSSKSTATTTRRNPKIAKQTHFQDFPFTSLGRGTTSDNAQLTTPVITSDHFMSVLTPPDDNRASRAKAR